MKMPFCIIEFVALFCLSISKAGGADALKPDSMGDIRDWNMLVPIALPEEGACAHLIFDEQIKISKSNYRLDPHDTSLEVK
jgi:hypothetical protein